MQAPSKPPAQPPFVDGYLAALLGQASQMISTEFHQVVRSHGFSVTEWRVLASLFGSKGMSIGHLATISLTSGVENLPSGRTVTLCESSGLRQTKILSESIGPTR